MPNGASRPGRSVNLRWAQTLRSLPVLGLSGSLVLRELLGGAEFGRRFMERFLKKHILPHRPPGYLGILTGGGGVDKAPQVTPPLAQEWRPWLRRISSAWP